MEKFPSQGPIEGNGLEKQPQKTASPEVVREANEQPIKISDLRAYVQYWIDHTRRVVAEAVDEKDKEIKKRTEDKFTGIASRISTHNSNYQINSVEDLVNSLEKEEVSYNERLDTAYSSKNAGEIKRIEKILKQIEETRDFVGRFKLDELKRKPFLEWQNAQTAKAIEEKTEVQKIERAKNAQEIKEAELMLSIMTDGSVGLYASLPEEYASSHGGHAGFGGVLDNRRIARAKKDESTFASGARGLFGLSDRNIKNKYDEAHVREFVALLPAKQDIYNEVEVSMQEKRFGGLLSKTVIEKKKVKVGERPVLHNEVVTNGKNERLSKLWYLAEPRKEDYPSSGLAYTDDVGRPGNFLCIEVLLPESEALKIMDEIKLNPAFIRKIVDGVVVKKMGVLEKIWGKNSGDGMGKYSLRPPYEKWDAESGGKIYIKEPGDEYVFNPERVRALKQ